MQLTVGCYREKMDTKQKILDASKELFNEKGYDNVKMRDISSKLGISVGNLTYHFKKKEDILKVLMETVAPLQDYDDKVSLNTLNQFIYDLILSIKDYLFFFTCDELFQLNLEFEKTNANRVESLIFKFRRMLCDLKKQGYFNDQLTDKTIEGFVEIMMMAHLSWARKVNINGLDSFPISKFISYHWTLLEPYFTQKAKIEYLEIEKKFNI